MKHLLTPRTWSEHAIFRLYKHLNIQEPHEIDLDLIAESCQIEIIRISGHRSYIMTHPMRKDWMIICINSLLPEQKQREKIAHEIFHYLAHAGNQLTLPISFIQLQENQSKIGAAHLLMPLWMLSNYDFLMEPNHLVYTLSSAFRVSVAFTRKRLQLIENRIKEFKRINMDFVCEFAYL